MMAYFANGIEGDAFDEECADCVCNQTCPVWAAQFMFNYDACNNEIATKILDMLVKDSGECQMKKCMKESGLKVEVEDE